MPADAPGPLPGALACPRHLTGLARATWHQAAAWLTAARTAGLECGPLLERYAVTFARWREAEAQVTELGLMLTAAGTGTPYVNPWVYLARGEATALLKLEAELGFGPSARGRVTKSDMPLVDDGGEAFLRARDWERLRVMTRKAT